MALLIHLRFTQADFPSLCRSLWKSVVQHTHGVLLPAGVWLFGVEGLEAGARQVKGNLQKSGGLRGSATAGHSSCPLLPVQPLQSRVARAGGAGTAQNIPPKPVLAHTWKLTGEGIRRAKGKVKHVREVLLQLTGDILLQPTHNQQGQQGTGLGDPWAVASPCPTYRLLGLRSSQLQRQQL